MERGFRWRAPSNESLRERICINQRSGAATTAPDLYEDQFSYGCLTRCLRSVRIYTACMQRPESYVLSLLAGLLDGTFFLWSRTVVPLSGAIFLSYGNS